MTSQVFSLAGGEISRRLWPRSDMDRYYSSVASLENFMVLPYGGITRRPGFQYIDTHGQAKVRLIPFRFSSTTALVLAFGNQTARVYKDGALVTNGGNPVTFATPYLSADLDELRTEQILDTVFIVHPNYAPRKLVRISDTTWTLTEFALSAQPFMDENVGTLTITPSHVSGNNRTLTASSALWTSDDYIGSHWRVGHVRAENTVALSISSNSSSSSILTQGEFVFKTTGTFVSTVNIEQSKNNSTWEVLQSWQIAGERNIEYIGTCFEPTYLRVTTTNFSSATGTPRATIDALNPVVWGSAKITARASSTSVTVEIIEPFLATTATTYWAEGSWSKPNGYPRQVILHDGRLWFAGTKREPLTLFASAIDEFDNFRREAESPDLALQQSLYSSTADKIQWLISRGGALIVGTAGDEWVIRNASDPDNASAEKSTAYGSAALPALTLNDSVLFVERRGTRIRDYIGLDTQRDDLARDPYAAGDLTRVAEHITSKGIVQMATSQQPDPIIWAVVDGKLVGVNYDRAESLMGWHKHVHSAGTIESVTTIPGAAGDEVWVSVKVAGSNDRRIERLHPDTPDLVLAGTASQCLFLDSGKVITGVTGTTVSGLSHLNGSQVDVLVAGGTHPRVTVASGSITLNQSVTNAVVCVGLPMTSTVETLPLVANTRAGMTRYKIGKISRILVDLYNSFGIEYSDAERNVFYQLQTRVASESIENPPSLRTGPVEASVAGIHSRVPRLKLRQATPLPAQILGLCIEWDSTETI